MKSVTCANSQIWWRSFSLGWTMKINALTSMTGCGSCFFWLQRLFWKTKMHQICGRVCSLMASGSAKKGIWELWRSIKTPKSNYTFCAKFQQWILICWSCSLILPFAWEVWSHVMVGTMLGPQTCMFEYVGKFRMWTIPKCMSCQRGKTNWVVSGWFEFLAVMTWTYGC